MSRPTGDWPRWSIRRLPGCCRSSSRSRCTRRRTGSSPIASATTPPGGLGRVTFNPLKHIDPFGTILLPALLILLRSPFPVRLCQAGAGQFRRLDNPRRDMVWVALAGPGDQHAAGAGFGAADSTACRLVRRAPAAMWLRGQSGAIRSVSTSILARLQHDPAAAARRRPGRGRAAAAMRWPCRWRGLSAYGMLILMLSFLLLALSSAADRPRSEHPWLADRTYRRTRYDPLHSDRSPGTSQ